MNLLVLLIVFGAQQLPRVREPVIIFAGLMRHWRNYWVEQGRRENWPPAVVIALMLFFPVVLTGLLFFFLNGVWHSVWEAAVSLIIMAVVLLDCAQPTAFAREQAQWLATPWHADIELSSAELLVLEQAAHSELLRAQKLVLHEQLHELFAPVCWFLLLGPLAALTYYVLRLAAAFERDNAISAPDAVEKNTENLSESEPSRTTAIMAQKILSVANWPVARLLSLSFALAGDFVGAWQSFRAQVFNRKITAVTLLSESAAAAHAPNIRLQAGINPNTVLIAELSAVKALVHRALVIWIVLLALHTLWP